MSLLSLPNALTLLNLLCGLAAISLSMTGDWMRACFWILASVLFDAADGWAARRLNQETRFGAFFDSVADFVSFGLAPVFIFHAAQGNLPLSAAIGFVFYVTASAFRLVRFHAEKKETRQRVFQGLPTTASALIFVGSLWVVPSVWTLWVLSFLMISRIPFSRFFS